MKFINFLIIIFITFPSTIKADSFKELKKELLEGNKLIFIRHAYAPGSGDPDNFDINDCNTQRNLSDRGKKQAYKIKNFFVENKIQKNELLPLFVILEINIYLKYLMTIGYLNKAYQDEILSETCVT